MKIKLNDEVVWLGEKRKVTAIHPMPFAVLALVGVDGHEEYLLRNNLDEFLNENTKEAQS